MLLDSNMSVGEIVQQGGCSHVPDSGSVPGISYGFPSSLARSNLEYRIRISVKTQGFRDPTGWQAAMAQGCQGPVLQGSCGPMVLS